MNCPTVQGRQTRGRVQKRASHGSSEAAFFARVLNNKREPNELDQICGILGLQNHLAAPWRGLEDMTWLASSLVPVRPSL